MVGTKTRWVKLACGALVLVALLLLPGTMHEVPYERFGQHVYLGQNDDSQGTLFRTQVAVGGPKYWLPYPESLVGPTPMGTAEAPSFWGTERAALRPQPEVRRALAVSVGAAPRVVMTRKRPRATFEAMCRPTALLSTTGQQLIEQLRERHSRHAPDRNVPCRIPNVARALTAT